MDFSLDFLGKSPQKVHKIDEDTLDIIKTCRSLPIPSASVSRM